MKLVAAFNHAHIFIDPDPDPEKSFAERERLFRLPRSGWRDYDASLISKGGGVFDRSAKAIALSPEIKRLLELEGESASGEDVIKRILTAPVDLLYNGGIGTYVKAASEEDADVGDRANDRVRVDGAQLRAKMVGEGGNLGFTQRGRIEAWAARRPSTPTPWTTPPASTPPTTRSTSRS
jgi:glutamate dehydrogenase